jgi:hypothetical protein
LSLQAEKAETVVRPAQAPVRPAPSKAIDESVLDPVRESALLRVVRSSAQGFARSVLDLRVEGGGE